MIIPLKKIESVNLDKMCVASNKTFEVTHGDP